MVVWRKVSQYGGLTPGGQWVYMVVDDCNPYALPRQDDLSLVYYADRVLAVGADLVVYESLDQGITWRASSDYPLPEGLTGTQVRMAADSQGRLWLISNTGQLWQASGL